MKAMLEKIKELLIQYKSIVTYVFFGGVTTVVNIVTYFIAYNCFEISNVKSTIIAWVSAVLVAFVTNKLWVFESKSLAPKVVLKELVAFISCRLLTGGVDVVTMYIGVDVLHFNGMLMKILDNVIVVVLNYLASKLLIFSKKESA